MGGFGVAYLTVEKKTFNPNTNYFIIDQVKLERNLVSYENELLDKHEKYALGGFWSIGIGVLLGLVCMIVSGILMTFSNWFVLGAIFGAACFVGGFMLAHCYFWVKEEDCTEELRKFRREHEEELWADQLAEIRTYNEEQEKIAAAWRAEHPFEEHIRICIKDPYSSVAIAEAATYYANHYMSKGN